MIGDIKWRTDGAWRLYLSEHGEYIAVHRGSSQTPDTKLEYKDDRLVWKRCPQGSLHTPILTSDFIAWLDQGGAKS